MRNAEGGARGQWRRQADTALDGARKERGAGAASIELDTVMKSIGELSMEAEPLRPRIEKPAPLACKGSRSWRRQSPPSPASVKHLSALGRAPLQLPRSPAARARELGAGARAAAARAELPPSASNNQAMRTALLARATAATVVGHHVIRLGGQPSTAAPIDAGHMGQAAAGIVALAPCKDRRLHRARVTFPRLGPAREPD